MTDNSEKYLRTLVSQGVGGFKCFNYESILITNTLSLLNVPAEARYAQMIVESTATGIALRYLQTKVLNVTSTIGMPLFNGGYIEVIDIANLLDFQVIKDQPGTTVLNVLYFK